MISTRSRPPLPAPTPFSQSVTDFYEPFQKLGPAKAKEIEFKHGTSMAKAATPTLEHYIWGTLIKSTKEYPVPHFESKYNVNTFIEADAALLAKSTFFVVCLYADNLALSPFHPQWVDSAKKYVQFTTYPPETPIQFIGEGTKKVTTFVKSIVEKSDETKNGTIVVGSIGMTTYQEWLDLWATLRPTRSEFLANCTILSDLIRAGKRSLLLWWTFLIGLTLVNRS